MERAHMLLDEPERQAWRDAAAALDAAERDGAPYPISRALAGLAHCYRALGAVASAELALELALRWSRSAGAVDPVVELLCELCETATTLSEALDAAAPGTGRAARERARDHAFEAGRLAGQVADPGWEAQVLLRISDVLDRLGDRDDATALQVRALRLLAGRRLAAPDPTQLPGLGRLADAAPPQLRVHQC